MSSVDESPRAMVSFKVGDEGSSIIERMHAIKKDEGIYILDNSPFYAFGISFGDTFATVFEDGRPVFSKIVLRGGHSTYRVKLAAGRGHAFFLNNWAALEDLGCTYEGSSANEGRLYSIDIPPKTSVLDVYRILEEKELENIWDFEEAHYFEPDNAGSGSG